MEASKPRILVITVPSWNSRVGANSWAALLEKYDSENVASIYIRDEIPDSPICSRYFCISESKVLKSVLKRKIKTGREVEAYSKEEDNTLNEHNERYAKFTKKHRVTSRLVQKSVNFSKPLIIDGKSSFSPVRAAFFIRVVPWKV